MTRATDHQERRGVVLFVVTVFVALASLAAYGFLLTMQGENMASRAAADQLQVAQVAASGEEFIAVWLQESRAERRTLADLYGEAVFAQLVRDPTLTGDGAFAGRFHVVFPTRGLVGGYRNRNSNTDAFGGAAMASAVSTSLDATDIEMPFEYGVRDESAKLHLRTLLAWDEIWPGAGRKALRQLPGMNESIADAILDWIDQDNSPREFGAEDEYYASQTPREYPLNGIPKSLDDLLKVRGVTPTLLLETIRSGENNNRDAAPTANSPIGSANPQGLAAMSATSVDGSSQPWVEFLTVHSAERNVAFDGSPRININDPNLAQLHSELLSQFPQELADFIILYRQYGPTEPPDVNPSVTGPSATDIDVDLSRPASYRIGAVAELIDAVVTLPPSKSRDRDENDNAKQPEPRHIHCPLSAVGGLNPELDNWLDRLTADRQTSIPGRLNLLAADPIVVLGLPFTDPGIATQILSMRETLSGDPMSVPGTSWILTAGLLDRDNFAKLSRFLTIGGDVVRFQVVATHPHSRLVDRYEVVLDGTVENTQRVYFRDLRREGRPQLFDMFYQVPSTNTPMTSLGYDQAR